MIELSPLKFASTNVHSAGFDGEARGNLYVQFKDKNDKLTTLGYYVDVQRAIYNALFVDRKPGAFIHQNLKGHFEWVVVSEPAKPESEFQIDPTLPSTIVIPRTLPNTLEAIGACIDSQRVEQPKKGLFE